MENEIVLQAKIIHTIFHNESNGYSVIKCRTYDASEEDFVAVGFFHKLDEDLIYEFQGNYIEHFRYGMQFQVRTYSVKKQSDSSSLIRYFSSSIFPGIGKKTATELVETLGENAINIISENPKVLDNISWLNNNKRQVIIKGVIEHNPNDDSIMFFMQHGISVRLIMKLEAVYGEQASKIVQENPYKLIEDVDGVGFKTADKLAMELEFPLDHPYRIKAMVLSTIMDICMSSGDSFTSVKAITKKIAKDFSFNLDINEYLSQLQQDRLVIVEADRVYHYTQYDAEKGIASYITNFSKDNYYVTHNQFSQAILNIEAELGIEYDDIQKEAMKKFFDEPISIITGGPGTGKSTIVQGILKLCSVFVPNMRVSLSAPTGRAAKRLFEIGDYPATTLHSLLKWDLQTNTFQANDLEPIPYDIVIIDEFSMVDAWLFYNFALASKSLKKLLIIGDEDQLPSVGCGSVLRDLISSKYITCTRLHKIFRQRDGSDVVSLAHQIRMEEEPSFDGCKDIAFFHARNFEIKEAVQSVVSMALDKGYSSSMIQVLAPMYSGVAGIDGLNHALQAMLNPPSDYKREAKVGYRIFRENDKILQLKNQPDDGVYNGDIGVIVEIVPASEDLDKQLCIICDFDGITVEYRGEGIYNLTHAYCISIHKAQGSEYPIVILPVVSDYRNMLQKRLLYTAVTRAKKSLVLLGDLEVFKKSIRREDHHARKTTLMERIQENVIK